MNPDVVAALIRARGYIERGWTVGAYARNAAGSKVSHRSPKAVCWCADGAVQAAVTTDYQDRLYSRCADVLCRFSYGSLVEYNDSLPDQAAALAWLDRAIAWAETEC